MNSDLRCRKTTERPRLLPLLLYGC
jgi:hypothetical protein